jgi:hypothetical protein
MDNCYSNVLRSLRAHQVVVKAVRTCVCEKNDTTHDVLSSLECLECGVVGKCCSNVLRSLIAYGVVVKAVCTCVYEKDNSARA